MARAVQHFPAVHPMTRPDDTGQHTPAESVLKLALTIVGVGVCVWCMLVMSAVLKAGYCVWAGCLF